MLHPDSATVCRAFGGVFVSGYVATMINDSTLAMLRCPQNQSPLQAADPGLVARLNAAISAGRVRNQVGEAVRETIDGALIRSDGELVYPIVDEIPVLLADEAIPLAQL